MEVNCQFQKADCSSLIALADSFGFSLPQLSVTSGTFDGGLKAVFPTSHRPYLEGEMTVEQLTFNPNEFPVQGQVELAKLKFEKNHEAYVRNEQGSTSIGQLDILKPAFLRYKTENNQWSLRGITGGIKFNGIETAMIALEAQADKPEGPSKWILQGTANLNAQRSLNLDLSLLCSSPDFSEGKIKLNLDQPENELKRAQIQLENMFYSELDFYADPFIHILASFQGY